MTFDELITQAAELLQREGRVSYRALKRRFALDDEYLEDVKAELIDAKRLATDEDGKVLVWASASPVPGSEFQVPSSTQSLAPSPQPPAGERRQLTVMFCDLVGSTALSTQLDPEELREVMRAYQHACVAVISHFEGYVGQYLGDGLLVYFGYPAAHEDDAARAARAGLDIIAAIQTLSLPPHLHLPHPLRVRVGIHTGLVVIGEIGSGEYRAAHAIVGETPNIAARLQDQALPNSVVISPTTARLVAGLFECQNLGPQTLKGISTPMAVYRVMRESGAQSRFEVAARTGLTPLIGRAHEVGLLRERWERAKQGEGQAVLLGGEAGIGKSRLVQELKEQVSAEGVTCLAFRCSPYHQNSAFYPIIEHVQRLLQFEREEPPQAKLSKLQQTLAVYRFLQTDTVALLAALLSLPHPEGVSPLTLSPQKQKQKTQEALVAWLVEEAERTPVYCVWEDLHWADPSTVEVLHLLLAQVPTARMLTLLTFRPEFTPPWGFHSHITPLTLSRLGHHHVSEMVVRVAGGQALPQEILHQIVAKTDGVPLFVEELTKTALESIEAIGSAIPATLHDALMARLDRMGSAKEIAQLGATLGREFSYELLQAVSPREDRELQQALGKLVEAEVLYRRGMLPQAQYLFKHALIQDVAYQSLLKSTRQQYHQQIARVLKEKFSETKEIQPEILAHHYTEAGLAEQAVQHWQQAGEKAIERSAYAEATSHFARGREILEALPDTPDLPCQRLSLQFLLGNVLMATKGYAAPEVEQTLAKTRELCRQVGENPLLFRVLPQLRGFHFVRGELETARELAEQQLTFAQRVQFPPLLVWAHYGLGETLLFSGELISAQAQLEQGVAYYDPQQIRAFSVPTVHDPKVACLTHIARILWYLGHPDQALKKMQEAVALARELLHPFSLAWALSNIAFHYQLRREEKLTQEWAETAITFSSEQGFPYWVARGKISQGWALAEQGQGEKGIIQIHQGLAVWQITGTELWRSPLYASLAEANGRILRPAEGLAALADAFAAMEKSKAFMGEAELYFLKGELTLQQQFEVTDPRHLNPDPRGEAEACFLKAVEIARKQQAKSPELRAATSLARLWQQQGKHHEARAMLSEIYNWFTEGFDTKDLQEAKTLIEELNH